MPFLKKTKTKTKNKSNASKAHQFENWLAWGLVGVVSVILVGISVSYWMFKSQFHPENGFVVIGDTTWTPTPGLPLPIKVLSSDDCGASCDATQVLEGFGQLLGRVLTPETINADSATGQDLIKKFAIKKLPQYFFTPEVEDVQAEGQDFLTLAGPTAFVKKDDLYHVQGQTFGFSSPYFLEAPTFADLDTEPQKGNGRVTIVEFTDYQCPYCKKLSNDNEKLIKELVDEGRITYVIKDFPLHFHPQAMHAHQAANCVLESQGQASYWDMHAQIFAQVQTWGSAADPKPSLISIAQGLGADITSCLNNQETQAEIQADLAEGQRHGVNGTPALFIGTQFMPGAIAPETLLQAVEQEEAKK